MKKLIAIGIVALLAASGGWYVWHGKKNGAAQFKTAVIKRAPLRAAVTATGTVNPVTLVLVGTQVSGRVKELRADFNSHVTQGQLLAQIDPTAFDAQLEQARANLAAADAALEKAQAGLNDAERQQKRARELFAAQAVSRSDLDQAETNVEYARAQLSGAKAQRQQAAAAVKSAETNLHYTRIVSPVDGVVVSRNVDVGQTVAASFQTPTLFSIARDLSKMQIDTNVNEADIGKIKQGQEVEFTVDAYTDLLFKGTVAQIRIAPAVMQNVVTYDVVVHVDNPDHKLKPGMTANVNIIVDRRENALIVPNAALRFIPKESKDSGTQLKGGGVWTLDGAAPRRVEAVTGISDGLNTEVSGAGLKEGMAVIIDTGAPKDKKNAAGGGHRIF